jgi:hypothetical protein
MPTTLTLAVMASLLVPVQAVKQPPTAPPLNSTTVLCQSDAQVLALMRPFDGSSLERRA